MLPEVASIFAGRAWITVILSLLLATPARAIDDRADIDPNEPVSQSRPVAWKLTAGSYSETGGAPHGVDLNLRGNTERHTFWVGHYRRGGEFDQTRAGLERQQSLPLGRLLLSGQIASHGFIGGSLTWDAPLDSGERWSGLIGFGRTNLKPYVNLNFDPNDSILVGAAWRPDAATQITFFQVRDDRLDTGQRVTHLVMRRGFEDGQRITIDLSRRVGREVPGAELRRGTGLAVTWDRDVWFVRLARDPGASFNRADMTRIALGLRF